MEWFTFIYNGYFQYKILLTEMFVACAQKHNFTNFRFIPIEEGDGLND